MFGRTVKRTFFSPNVAFALKTPASLVGQLLATGKQETPSMAGPLRTMQVLDANLQCCGRCHRNGKSGGENIPTLYHQGAHDSDPLAIEFEDPANEFQIGY
ncbi:hypothetical protein RND81_09G007700 [Saponaria officinalis]|uniref:Uncharacterized protein n=1 Tax=Saponaria officinalis TaxID=3572 RepID=A0AAW1IH45_SAPOF